MTYYSRRYYKRYNYRRHSTKTHRKRSPKSTPEFYLVLILVFGAGLHYLGATTEQIIQLSFIAISVIFVFYLLIRFFVNDWFDFRSMFRAWKTRKMKDIDEMSGIQFERYIAKMLKRHNFADIQITEYYDYGVDIIAKKNGVTWGIQTKRYSNQVKADAVRQVYSALKHYKCDRGMVITNNTFTNPAKKLAEENHIILIDRYMLAKKVAGGDI